MDLPLIFMFLMGLSVLALQQSSIWGWGSAKTWICLAIGMAILAAFVRYELRVENPLLRLTVFKDKAFAKGVNRDDVRNGAAELGIPLEEHVAFCIAAMRERADALGLRGNLGAQAAS